MTFLRRQPRGVFGGAGLDGESEAMDAWRSWVGRILGVSVPPEGAARGGIGVTSDGAPAGRRIEAEGTEMRDSVGPWMDSRHWRLDGGFFPVGGVIEAQRREESKRRRGRGGRLGESI